MSELTWDAAKAAFDAARAAEIAYDAEHIDSIITAPEIGKERSAQADSIPRTVWARSEELGEARCIAEEAVVSAPAPDLPSVLFKIEWARTRWSDHEDWPDGWWVAVLADLRRLAEPMPTPELNRLMGQVRQAEYRYELDPSVPGVGRYDTPLERAYLDAFQSLEDYEPRSCEEFVRQYAAIFDDSCIPTYRQVEKLAARACRLAGVSRREDERFDAMLAIALERHAAVQAAYAASPEEAEAEAARGALDAEAKIAFDAVMRTPVTDGPRVAAKLDLIAAVYDDKPAGMDGSTHARVRDEVIAVLRRAA